MSQNGMTYEDFIDTKRPRVQAIGFDVKESDLHASLFDFQRHVTAWAIKLGRAAVWGDCGLGKTIIQLVWADVIARQTGGKVLILAPLAVTGQTIDEGRKFGIEVVHHTKDGDIDIANYESLHKLNTAQYVGVVLDESGILKDHTGKTRQAITDAFRDTKYKLCCTATPAPNDPMEIGTHAEFLGVMTRNEVLSMYFVHDGGNTSQWRIKNHAREHFYAWVSTWAKMFTRPSDLGFSDEGFVLPALNIQELRLETPPQNNGRLFNDTAVSATEFNAELRRTASQRIDAVVDLVNSNDEQWIVWCKHNAEGDELAKRIRGAVQVRGSDSTETKERNLLGFARNEFRTLVTKGKIAQWGLNFQGCHNQVVCSVDFSFESLYQMIRRSYRFGQKEVVNIWLVVTDTMTNVIESVRRKEHEFKIMQKLMSESLNANQRISLSDTRPDESNEHFTLKHGDCVRRISEIESESVGLSIFSPPFAELYVYSDYPEDMGNVRDYREFMAQFGFLVPELFRVMWSGRNVVVHCMDLPIQKGKEGFIGLRDFPSMIRRLFERAGFIFHSRVTIWKDPVTEMQRTKALGLLHKQVRKDAAMSRVGLPDYLMVFRKPGEHAHPVKCDIPVSLWQKYASPVWHDINYSGTLNRTDARDEKDEKHIAPLQLQTIERCIHLWSNEGDTVLSPFAGIGSEVYEAVRMNRFGIGIELKQSYFDQAVLNCRAAVAEKNQMALAL